MASPSELISAPSAFLCHPVVAQAECAVDVMRLCCHASGRAVPSRNGGLATLQKLLPCLGWRQTRAARVGDCGNAVQQLTLCSLSFARGCGRTFLDHRGRPTRAAGRTSGTMA